MYAYVYIYVIILIFGAIFLVRAHVRPPHLMCVCIYKYMYTNKYVYICRYIYTYLNFVVQLFLVRAHVRSRCVYRQRHRILGSSPCRASGQTYICMYIYNMHMYVYIYIPRSLRHLQFGLTSLPHVCVCVRVYVYICICVCVCICVCISI